MNTFGIAASADRYASFSDEQQLQELLTGLTDPGEALILGGGSNVLFTRDPALVLKNEIRGIAVVREDTHHVYVRAGAGENWHAFVTHCIAHNWAGLENLSLIPGNTGASPIQNIGAYGVEVKDVFYQLEAFHLKEKCKLRFAKEACDFGYRNSVFKHKYKGQLAILNVTYKLNKKPNYNVSYGAITKELDAMGVTTLSIQAISQAVINIRSSKLPDPRKIGNAGSFFKNPQVSAATYKRLKQDYPEMVAFAVEDGYKLAAGWLIEQCGWKGYREGDAGVHAKQALVLVNYGHAPGQQIYLLSEKIKESVLDKFGVTLEREVNIV